jgi:ribonuclease P protein component
VLAKINRMRRPDEFRSAVRGRRAASRTLVVHAATVGRDTVGRDAPARVGVVVSRAVGNSVVRHRVQRRLRAAIRPLLPRLGSDLVVLRALPAAATADFAALRADLDCCVTSVERRRP